MYVLKRDVEKIANGWVGEDTMIHVYAIAQVGVRFEPGGKAALLPHTQYHVC